MRGETEVRLIINRPRPDSRSPGSLEPEDEPLRLRREAAQLPETIALFRAAKKSSLASDLARCGRLVSPATPTQRRFFAFNQRRYFCANLFLCPLSLGRELQVLARQDANRISSLLATDLASARRGLHFGHLKDPVRKPPCIHWYRHEDILTAPVGWRVFLTAAGRSAILVGGDPKRVHDSLERPVVSVPGTRVHDAGHLGQTLYSLYAEVVRDLFTLSPARRVEAQLARPPRGYGRDVGWNRTVSAAGVLLWAVVDAEGNRVPAAQTWFYELATGLSRPCGTHPSASFDSPLPPQPPVAEVFSIRDTLVVRAAR